jgi:hypothetical protein
MSLVKALISIPRWIEAARAAKKKAGQIYNRITKRKPEVGG